MCGLRIARELCRQASTCSFPNQSNQANPTVAKRAKELDLDIAAVVGGPGEVPKPAPLLFGDASLQLCAVGANGTPQPADPHPEVVERLLVERDHLDAVLLDVRDQVRQGLVQRMPDGIWMFGGPTSMGQYVDGLVTTLGAPMDVLWFRLPRGASSC